MIINGTMYRSLVKPLDKSVPKLLVKIQPQAKEKQFSLKDVLILTTDQDLAPLDKKNDAADRVMRIVKHVLGNEPAFNPHNIMGSIGALKQSVDLTRKKVLEQHPQLKDIKPEKPLKDIVDIGLWLEKQVKKFGEKIAIKPQKSAMSLGSMSNEGWDIQPKGIMSRVRDGK